ncbi:MAG: carboxymuconolactone decarboxylase family protein [Candidatus Thiodiazotropha sp.]
MQSEYKLSLPVLEAQQAEPLARDLLVEAEKKLGFIPNMYKFMANSPGMLDTYVQGYSHFRENSGFSPTEQEVVFLTISRENGCNYCMGAHSFIADKMSGVPTQVTDAIRDGQTIEDTRLSVLHQFTKNLLNARGLPNKSDVAAFLDAGYGERHILEIILAISVKTISNYSNHLFHTPLDGVFSERSWEE